MCLTTRHFVRQASNNPFEFGRLSKRPYSLNRSAFQPDTDERYRQVFYVQTNHEQTFVAVADVEGERGPLIDVDAGHGVAAGKGVTILVAALRTVH